MKTTECNEVTFSFSGHRDSPPSLPSLAAHAQASSPSPPCAKQHASFPLLPCAPFLEPPLCVSSPSSLRLFSLISLSSASHRNSFCIHSLSSGLISVLIHCSKSQSGGGVCNKCNGYKTNKSCKTSFDTINIKQH